MALVTPRDEWLADLDEPLRILLRDAENYAAGERGFGDAKPPTERVFAEALNAIRYARRIIREERRRARLDAEFGAPT